MGLVQKLRDAVRNRRARKAREITQEFANQLFTSPICSDYENVFAQVRPLIDEMVSVVPFGVGRNGARKPMNETPELAALYDPNDDMGGIEFLDTMFAGWLTENQLYVHVHFTRSGSIEGYTILPPDSLVNLGNGEKYWQVSVGGEIQNLYEDEVITLCYSRSPRGLRGVSPASAIRLYAQIDDLLAQFEKAYLENGAIPASITIIRASTQEKFNEARRELEGQLKGASNRNKTIYLWRQFNNDDGTERDQVEVKTIQGNNNTLAIRELVDVVNDRLNKAYGVSNFILGDDSSAKYDNAELSDFQFTRRRVKPALRKFWNEFQHELDRITGGLGYAISFQLDMPELTERKKVEAETSEKNVKNIKELVQAGSKPVAACVALGLDIDRWAPVATGIYNRVLIDREYQLQSAQASLAVSRAPETETKTEPETKAEEITPQRGQEHHHEHEHTNDYFQPFSDAEKTEKKIFERLMSLARAIFAENPNIDLDAIADEIYRLLENEANLGGEQALEAIAQLVNDPDVEKAIREMLKNGVSISNELAQRLHERTEQLVQGYDKYTREVMRSVIENSEGLSASEIKKRLSEVIPDYRAATIARNEVVYAFKSGHLELDEGIAEEYNLTMELEWHTNPQAGEVCPECQAMEGKRTKLGQAFTPEPVDYEKTDKDGNTYAVHSEGWSPSIWNDYGLIPNAHVNCKCTYLVVNVEKNK